MDNNTPEYYELVDALVGMACQHLSTGDNDELDDLGVSAGEICIAKLNDLGLIENNRIINNAFDVSWLEREFRGGWFLMRLLVCGGRNYSDRDRVYSYLDAVHKKRPVALLMQGGANGADALAKDWALDNLIPCLTLHANWKKLGKGAGPVRNGDMICVFSPDGLVAFPGDDGTADMVSKAKKAGITVAEVSA